MVAGLMITRRKGRWGGPTNSSKKRGKGEAARSTFLCPGLTKEGHFSSPLENPPMVGLSCPTAYVRVWSSEDEEEERKVLGRSSRVPVALTRKPFGADNSYNFDPLAFLRPPQLGRRARSFGIIGKTRKEASTFFCCQIAVRDWVFCAPCARCVADMVHGQLVRKLWSRATRRTTRRDSDSADTPPRRKRAHHRHRRRGKVGPKR